MVMASFAMMRKAMKMLNPEIQILKIILNFIYLTFLYHWSLILTVSAETKVPTAISGADMS